MSFVTYQCTICRRTKGIEKNNTHVLPNQCIISKGCAGRLIPVGETEEMANVAPLAGVEDWYPRGTKIVKNEEVPTAEQFSLSTSSSGSLTLAIKLDPTLLPIQLHVQLEQKKVQAAEFQQYLFKVNASHQSTTTILTGKDSNGKNLRFTEEAVNEDRIQVRVNGVPTTDVTFIPQNKIVFNTLLPIGTLVDVVVTNDTTIESRTITFTRNKSLIPSLTRGSWSNIDYVDVMGEKWYLYSADSLGSLSQGKIRVVGNDVTSDAMYLLASTPYQSMDRYLNWKVSEASLSDFNITYENGELVVDAGKREEIYPPFKLDQAAYISGDQYTIVTSSQVVTDTELVRFKSNKILGPV